MMENEKKYGVIDTFTLVYCMVSCMLMAMVLSVVGASSVMWWEWLLIIMAPYVVDCVLTTIITVYAVCRKLWLWFKKRVHEKKNPPQEF